MLAELCGKILYYGNSGGIHYINKMNSKLEEAAAGDPIKEVQPAIRTVLDRIAWGSVAAMCVIGAVVVVLVPNPNPENLLKGLALGGVAICLVLGLDKVLKRLGR